MALNWLKSYPSVGVSLSVSATSLLLVFHKVRFFGLCFSPLFDADGADLKYHFYADDIQLNFTSRDPGLPLLLDCLNAIKHWTTGNFLLLNAEKIEVLVVAPDSIIPVLIKHNVGLLSSAV